jgi:hypothetical protein
VKARGYLENNVSLNYCSLTYEETVEESHYIDQLSELFCSGSLTAEQNRGPNQKEEKTSDQKSVFFISGRITISF